MDNPIKNAPIIKIYKSNIFVDYSEEHWLETAIKFNLYLTSKNIIKFFERTIITIKICLCT